MAVVHAHRADGEWQVNNVKRLQNFVTHRVSCFRAEAPDVPVGIVSRQRGQIHDTDGAQQPRRLPFLFHGTSPGERRGPTFDRAPIYAETSDDVEIEREAGIPHRWVIYRSWRVGPTRR